MGNGDSVSFSAERAIRLRRTASILKLDDPEAAMSFTDRLAREQYGWTRDFATRVVAEYERYFLLMALSERPVTPSESVDQAWHLHLVYTRSYHEWCEALSGQYIHHGPTKGGSAEGTRFEGQYGYTLALYEAVFGEAPPSDIWPAAEIRFSPAERAVWVRPAAMASAPRPNLRTILLCALLIGVVLGSLLTVAGRYSLGIFEATHAQSQGESRSDSLSDQDGSSGFESFVGVAAFCAIGAVVVLAGMAKTAKPGRRDGGNGGDGGGGGCGSFWGGDGCSSDGGSGCSSGCGGGCGGCGG